MKKSNVYNLLSISFIAASLVSQVVTKPGGDGQQRDQRERLVLIDRTMLNQTRIPLIHQIATQLLHCRTPSFQLTRQVDPVPNSNNTNQTMHLLKSYSIQTYAAGPTPLPTPPPVGSKFVYDIRHDRTDKPDLCRHLWRLMQITYIISTIDRQQLASRLASWLPYTTSSFSNVRRTTADLFQKSESRRLLAVSRLP